MATNLENLQARQTAIYTELAALNTSTAGGRPNISGGGAGTVDHVGYRLSLYKELEELGRQINSAEGPWEISLVGRSA